MEITWCWTDVLAKKIKTVKGACNMSGNSFGRIFRYTTFGESHGPAIGCVIDGVPPRIPLDIADIQPWMDKRRPASPNIPPNVPKRIKWKFSLVFLMGKPRARPLGFWCIIKTSARKITARSRWFSPRSCGLYLLEKIWYPWLSWRGAVFGKRNRHARSGERGRKGLP